MTVRVERTFDIDAPPEDVWAFISDPERRAAAISVVAGYERTGEHRSRWHVTLPIPLVDRTVSIELEDVEYDPPTRVKFVGRSKAMAVTGEHDLRGRDGGSRLVNRFVVDGRLPGIERYFRKHLDEELENLEAALRAEVEA